jgi:hypothetical protein
MVEQSVVVIEDILMAAVERQEVVLEEMVGTVVLEKVVAAVVEIILQRERVEMVEMVELLAEAEVGEVAKKMVVLETVETAEEEK